jgi:hypothetical protein
LLLQAAYSDHQIGAFENFHQLVENTLIVLRPGPKVFFQYELRFVNRLKSQLLISHLFLPIKQMPPKHQTNAALAKRWSKKSSHFWEISPLFRTIRSIFVSMQEPSTPDRGGFLVPHHFHIFEWPRA